MTEWPPRHKPLTIRDVARAAGVSTALVSIVFRGVPGASEQTRARVFAVAEQLGYRANRTASLMKLRRTKHLGVTVNVRSAFQAELAENIQAAAIEFGYEIVLSLITPAHDESRAIETLLGFRCESAILLGSQLPKARLRELAWRAAARLGGAPDGSRPRRRGAFRGPPRPSASRGPSGRARPPWRSSTSTAVTSPSPPSDGRVTGPR